MPDLLRIGSASPEMLARMTAAFDVHVLADLPEGWLSEHGAKITHVATNGHAGVAPEIMDALPNLQMISCYGVGYDAIDTDVAVARGIKVSHTPDVLNGEVATTAVMLMLACYRELLRDDAYVRSSDWETKGNAPLTRSPDNRKVGILGLGRIGSEIATRLAPWNPTIVYHTRSRKNLPYQYYPSLLEMARDVDVLISVVPGGASTTGIVTRDVLEALGPDGTFINVGRGSVADQPALIELLQSGKLGWAGLDVFAEEPHVPQALCDLPNVVLLPHVGSATVETRAAMGKLMVDNLINHLEHSTVLTPVPECAALN